MKGFIRIQESADPEPTEAQIDAMIGKSKVALSVDPGWVAESDQWLASERDRTQDLKQVADRYSALIEGGADPLKHIHELEDRHAMAVRIKVRWAVAHRLRWVCPHVQTVRRAGVEPVQVELSTRIAVCQQCFPKLAALHQRPELLELDDTCELCQKPQPENIFVTHVFTDGPDVIHLNCCPSCSKWITEG